jgi:hypothetical protein
VQPFPGVPPFSISESEHHIMSNVTPNPPAAEPQLSGSTGPRTEAGKAASSQNARKHDLCSKTLRLSAEEWAEYNEMRACYGRDLQPADYVEETLVDEICFNYWRLQQARGAEFTAIAEHPTDLRIISLYIRYRTGYERSFYKALDRIQKSQRDRRKQASSQGQEPLAPVALAAVPLAAVALAPVRSAKLETAPASSPALRPVEPVHSAEQSHGQELQEQIDDHALENCVRGELCLPPLPLPKELWKKVEHFVSQNRGSIADQLTEALKLAA